VSDWTFAVGPWRDTGPSRALVTDTARKVTWRLDDNAEANVTIDGRGDDAAALAVLESDLWVWRDTLLLFRGRIVTAPESIDVDRHTVAVTAVDYRGMLARRFLQADATFTQWAQGEIAWYLVNHTQTQPGGDLGITRGVVTAGQARDRTYPLGDNIGERIAELGRVEGGFEWWIDPQRQLNIAANRGEATTTVLDYGGTVASLRREPDVGGFANTVVVSGGQGTTREIRTGDVTGNRGRWEGSYSYPDVTEQPTLAGKANRLLAEGQQPPIAYTLTLAPGAWPGAAPLTVGDTATLRLQSGRRDEQLRVRVSELTVAIDESGNETVTVAATAVEAVPLVAARPLELAAVGS
jgi:hypothetical protein